jgi:hypothetical protein
MAVSAGVGRVLPRIRTKHYVHPPGYIVGRAHGGYVLVVPGQASGQRPRTFWLERNGTAGPAILGLQVWRGARCPS